MGCDGGSIPRRIELVKTKEKDPKPDAQSQLTSSWFYCALSKLPLQLPVVGCCLGKLYNKDALIEYLLDKKSFGDGDLICSHISSIKDVSTLNLTNNSAYSELNSMTSTIQQNVVEKQIVSKFACPITMKEMNGNSRFSFISTCGCVLSEQALKEIPSNNCLKCNKEFDTQDSIPLNSTKSEEIQLLKLRMEKIKQERAVVEAEKKKAKLAAKKLVGAAGGTIVDGEDKKKRKRDKEIDDLQIQSQKKSTRNKDINMNLPDLNDPTLVPEHMRVKSKAIQSLYKKKDEKEDHGKNYMIRSFNRYAAAF